MSSMFGDDPFFSEGHLLWPLSHMTLSALQQDFFNQRTKMADSLLMELHDSPRLLRRHQLPLIPSSLLRLSDGEEQRASPSAELHQEAQQAKDNTGDFLVTLDARGYAPGDITVKLEGRSLAVAAMKQAGAEETNSCSSSTSHASFCSSASAKTGFARRIALPPHLDLGGLSCCLMDDGQLRIHAPAAKQPISDEQEVPVRFKSELEFPITKDDTETHTD